MESRVFARDVPALSIALSVQSSTKSVQIRKGRSRPMDRRFEFKAHNVRNEHVLNKMKFSSDDGDTAEFQVISLVK